MVYKVGLLRIFYEDADRSSWDGTNPRPLLTDVWYPAVDTAVEVDVSIGPPNTPFFNAGKSARDAEFVIAPASFPLVLLSHGTGGASLQLGWLAWHLASEGYIVAGINHHGNNLLEPYTAQGFTHYWERPRDLTAVLNQLLVDPLVGARIDPDRIGAGGFSLGGYTMMAIAGAVTKLQLLIEKSGRDLSKEIPEFLDPAALAEEIKSLDSYTAAADASYRDPRVRCIFAIAPALGEAFSPEGLSPIRIPVKIVVGDADRSAPATANASYFAEHIKGAELTILEKVAHYTFLAEATEAGKRELPLFCLDPPGVSRVSIHRTVATWAKEFFEKHLK